MAIVSLAGQSCRSGTYIFMFTSIHTPTRLSPMLPAHLAEEFSIGFGLHQLRYILRQCVIQLTFLIVSTVTDLLDLK